MGADVAGADGDALKVGFRDPGVAAAGIDDQLVFLVADLHLGRKDEACGLSALAHNVVSGAMDHTSICDVHLFDAVNAVNLMTTPQCLHVGGIVWPGTRLPRQVQHILHLLVRTRYPELRQFKRCFYPEFKVSMSASSMISVPIPVPISIPMPTRMGGIVFMLIRVVVREYWGREGETGREDRREGSKISVVHRRDSSR